ncbi:hypothetical protein D3C84_1049690 [compost metagenome]
MMQHQPHDRRTGIAADEGPRLRQRPGMHGKQQHRRGRQGAEQVQRDGTAKGITAGHARQKQPEQGAEACA